MVCVVCQQPIREAHYANDWEKVRKVSPCCSDTCATRFDPDVHWLPATAPAPVTGDEEVRLVRIARMRVTSGDHPSVVVREMLVAGVSVIALRKILHDAARDADAADRTRHQLGLLATLRGVLTGRWRVDEESRGASPALIALAAKDLEVWRTHFAPNDQAR